MDMRTGKMYDSEESARAAGVPASDLARLECGLSQVEQRLRDGKPVVTFSKGSFKSVVRNEAGDLVPVGRE